MSRADRVVFVLVAVLAATAGAAAIRARAFAGGTPPWDEASHGLQGYAIAQDIARLDVPDFAVDVLGTRYRYPFGHSVLLVPAYALFGPTWLTAAGVSAFLFAVMVVLLFFAGRSLARPPGDGGAATPVAAGSAPLAAGLLAAALGLTSPAFLAQATTIMLEIPAAAFVVLVLWLYGRALDAPSSEGRLRAVGWALTAFMLTASQYATVWILAVALYEAWRSRPEDRRAVWAWAKGALGGRALWHPLHIAAALAFAFAAVVVLTGGWEIHAGSRTISVRRPGNALTVGIVLLAARAIGLIWRHRERLRAVVPARHRILFATVVVPLFLWFFVIHPSRFTHYVNWVMRSPPSIPRTELAHWTFYPEVVVTQGHLVPLVAAGVLALALASFLRREVPEKVRFLRLAVAVSALFVLAHHARQDRFILPMLPAVWLLASVTAATAQSGLRRPWLRRGVGAAAAVALGAAFALAAVALYRERLPGLARSRFTHAELGLESVILRVADEAAPARSVRIIGTFAGLSDHLFEWELRRRVDLRGRVLKSDLENPLERHGTDPQGSQRVVEAWLSKSPEELVFTLEPVDLMERPAKPLEGLWKHDLEWTYRTMRLLRGTDRYAVAGSWDFPAAGLRVRKYALREGRAPVPGK